MGGKAGTTTTARFFCAECASSGFLVPPLCGLTCFLSCLLCLLARFPFRLSWFERLEPWGFVLYQYFIPRMYVCAEVGEGMREG